MRPTDLRRALPASLLLASTLLSGCEGVLDRLDRVGQPAKLSEIQDPIEKPTYKPLSWPMPETPPPQKQYANSLWQPGARAFFRDGRASRVGDILKVSVKINDKLQFNNQTQGKRTTTDQAKAASVLGFGNKLVRLIPGSTADPANLLNVAGTLDTKGTGTIQRQDVITTQVAAMVTQLLPNGNMVIEGTQEVVMNFDVREVSVKGVVRPQDIAVDNSIDSAQIAEARINYSSRGQLSDAQRPRYGGQIIDAISPF